MVNFDVGFFELLGDVAAGDRTEQFLIFAHVAFELQRDAVLILPAISVATNRSLATRNSITFLL